MAVSPSSNDQCKIYEINSEGDTLSGIRIIDKIVWYNKAGTRGDDLLIKDADSEYTIVEAYFWTEIPSIYELDRICYNGIKVVTLDAGKIFVYEEQGRKRERHGS